MLVFLPDQTKGAGWGWGWGQRARPHWSGFSYRCPRLWPLLWMASLILRLLIKWGVALPMHLGTCGALGGRSWNLQARSREVKYKLKIPTAEAKFFGGQRVLPPEAPPLPASVRRASTCTAFRNQSPCDEEEDGPPLSHATRRCDFCLPSCALL